jgi:hypothetical protein
MQAFNKELILLLADQQFRLQHFLFIIEFPAVETVSTHMFEFFGAGLPFVQQPAAPVKIHAAPGEAFLFFEDVVNRHPVGKPAM